MFKVVIIKGGVQNIQFKGKKQRVASLGRGGSIEQLDKEEEGGLQGGQVRGDKYKVVIRKVGVQNIQLKGEQQRVISLWGGASVEMLDGVGERLVQNSQFFSLREDKLHLMAIANIFFKMFHSF